MSWHALELRFPTTLTAWLDLAPEPILIVACCRRAELEGQTSRTCRALECADQHGLAPGRTQTNGVSDYDNVHAFQRGMRLMPASAYPNGEQRLGSALAFGNGALDDVLHQLNSSVEKGGTIVRWTTPIRSTCRRSSSTRL